MRRRLDLAAGLVSRPSVIFLDEPTTGLDLPSRQALWAMVGSLAGSGSTVFLTTQYLEEADMLADQVAVLDRGRVAALGSPAELKARFAAHTLDDVFLALMEASTR
jgi:ABC-2 type transport system ATP-binding protein